MQNDKEQGLKEVGNQNNAQKLINRLLSKKNIRTQQNPLNVKPRTKRSNSI